MRLLAGTSGYSYKEWKGPFYPEDLPAREMLHFYASQLPAVEINNTFYRLPKASVLAAWAEQVPDDFRFVVKASRRITHFKRLKDTGDETGYLLSSLETLGDRLGAVLFQLPPKLALDLPRLEAFLALLPDATRAAFEFRHPSWLEAPVFDLLRDRDFAVVSVDAEDEEIAEPVETASWGYLRLRRPGYERADLADWAQRVQARSWDEAFVFFKHEDAGSGPRMASEFLSIAERSGARKPAVPARPRDRRRKAG